MKYIPKVAGAFGWAALRASGVARRAGLLPLVLAALAVRVAPEALVGSLPLLFLAFCCVLGAPE